MNSLNLGLFNDTSNATLYYDQFELEELERKGYSDEEKSHLQMYNMFAFVIGSLIIVTNLIVVISSGLIIKTGQEPKSTYLQLGNASLAHIFTGASVIFDIGLPKRYTTHNLCVLEIGMIVSGTITSIYSVGLIAVDRFMYILYNHHHKKWVTTKKVRLSIILVWILGIVPAYMPITGWAGDTNNGIKCWYIKLAPPPLLVINSAIGIIPVFVVCVLYSILLYEALKKVKQLKQASRTDSKDFTEEDNSKLRVFSGRNSSISITSSNRSVDTVATNISSDINYKQNDCREIPIEVNRTAVKINALGKTTTNAVDVIPRKKKPTKWKAIKVVLFTTGSFACTWVPYFIAILIYVSCMHNEDQTNCKAVEVALASPLAILGLFHSLVSPVIYVWWHKGFTSTLNNIFLKQMKICRINSSDLR